MSRYLFSTSDGDVLVYSGSVKLNGATPVTVSNVPIKAGKTTVEWGLTTVGGSVGAEPQILTITPSTAGGTPGPQGAPPFNGSFTVAGTAGDTSTYEFRITN